MKSISISDCLNNIIFLLKINKNSSSRTLFQVFSNYLIINKIKLISCSDELKLFGSAKIM